MKHEDLPDDAGLLAVRPALSAAAAVWRDQADPLRHASVVLGEADVGPLGAWVAPVAALFLDGWAAHLADLTRVVADHGDGLLAAWSLADLVDGATADRMAGRIAGRTVGRGGLG